MKVATSSKATVREELASWFGTFLLDGFLRRTCKKCNMDSNHTSLINLIIKPLCVIHQKSAPNPPTYITQISNEGRGDKYIPHEYYNVTNTINHINITCNSSYGCFIEFVNMKFETQCGGCLTHKNFFLAQIWKLVVSPKRCFAYCIFLVH